jgi:hypothetical protein
MKVTELMIGDCVKYQGHSYIVEEISANGWVHLIHPETKARLNLASDYIIDLLEPIPLTSEILKMNGFVIKKKWAQKGNFGDNPIIMWHYDDDIITRDFKHELEIHQNDTGKVHIEVQCDYVHELQRILRICGLDNLADNFKMEE